MLLKVIGFVVRLSGDSFSEEDDLRQLISSPPSLVILGQTQAAKALLVNKLFNETIYPVISEEEERGLSCRTVRYLIVL